MHLTLGLYTTPPRRARRVDLADLYRHRPRAAFTSFEAARLLHRPLAAVNAAFRSAQRDGAARLEADGWVWCGGGEVR